MIDVLNRDAVDSFRRVTWYGRRQGSRQQSLFECSLTNWCSNWVVIGVPVSDLISIPFHYPTWLHNVYKGFGLGRPEPLTGLSGDAYRLCLMPPEVRCYPSLSALRSDLGYEPHSEDQELDCYAAVKIPAGKITTSPVLLEFEVPDTAGDRLWVPASDRIPTKTENTFYQNDKQHMEHSDDLGDHTCVRSEYQACVFTNVKATSYCVDPAKEYYRRLHEQAERKSEWITIN